METGDDLYTSGGGRGEVSNLVFYAKSAITVISGHWGGGAMETGDDLYTSGGGKYVIWCFTPSQPLRLSQGIGDGELWRQETTCIQVEGGST